MENRFLQKLFIKKTKERLNRSSYIRLNSMGINEHYLALLKAKT